MSINDLIDKENLVCTFCGKGPVVGVTFAIDVEIEDDDQRTPGDVDPNSIVAVCKVHLPILQEQFEREVKESHVAELHEEDNDA
jgi:hypothetical protein